MRTVIVGMGPTGLILGACLARRGHQVLGIDRDPGPTGQHWPRRGVMQFEHAHGFRPQVAQTLRQVWPEALNEWVRLGAEPVGLGPAADDVVMLSRRITFERALHQIAADCPDLTLRTGHVEDLMCEMGRTGVVVDGEQVAADLVVDASGRTGRIGREFGRDELDVSGDCGLAYVDRAFRLKPGSPLGPMTTPLGHIAEFDGYQCLVFLHEHGHFSVVLVRPTADEALKDLRFDTVFEAACRVIPVVCEWTDPARALPTSKVLVGGALRNVYRRQIEAPGLVTVGDAVATTTPTRGRGIAMACMQISALLELLDEGAEPGSIATPFGQWCAANIEPWVLDHIAIDGGSVRRWEGHDIDLSRPLTSDLIAAAVEVDPRIGQYAGGYFSMSEPPEALLPAEPWARAVYEGGWRPSYAPGPTRDELVQAMAGGRDDHHDDQDRSVPFLQS